MGKTIKIALAVLFVLTNLTTAEVKEDLDKFVKEINERLGLTEEKLMMTQEELQRNKEELLMTKDELQELKKRMKMAEDDQKVTKEDLITTKEDLLATMEHLKAKDVLTQNLEREVSFLREPLWTFTCGEIFSVNVTSKTISYDTLFYSSSNVPGAGLDISTGVFTSGHPGSYTVSWSLKALNDAGNDAVDIFLRKNGGNIAASQQATVYTGPSGHARDQGGRTLVLHLDRGDTLDLYCVDCSAGIEHTTFCVSLSQADVE